MKYKKRPKPLFIYLLISIGISFVLAILFVTFSHLTAFYTTDNAQTDNSPFVLSSSYLLAKAVQKEHSLSPAANFNMDYDVEPKAQAAGTVRIPVLTYHHIAPLPSNIKTRDYYVSPEMFDIQMRYLTDKNYKTITPKEFYDILISGKNPEQKTVLITFDDGYANHYQNAFPILKKYKMTGTFFIPSHSSGISASHIKEMANAGMVIDPHSKTHMLLGNITDSELLYQELVVSKFSLQSRSGKTSYSFCYPGCEYNGSVTATLANNGYLLGFTCGRNIDHRKNRRFSIERMHVYNDLDHLKSILSGVWYYPEY